LDVKPWSSRLPHSNFRPVEMRADILDQERHAPKLAYWGMDRRQSLLVESFDPIGIGLDHGVDAPVDGVEFAPRRPGRAPSA